MCRALVSEVHGRSKRHLDFLPPRVDIVAPGLSFHILHSAFEKLAGAFVLRPSHFWENLPRCDAVSAARAFVRDN